MVTISILHGKQVKRSVWCDECCQSKIEHGQLYCVIYIAVNGPFYRIVQSREMIKMNAFVYCVVRLVVAGCSRIPSPIPSWSSLRKSKIRKKLFGRIWGKSRRGWGFKGHGKEKEKSRNFLRNKCASVHTHKLSVRIESPQTSVLCT